MYSSADVLRQIFYVLAMVGTLIASFLLAYELVRAQKRAKARVALRKQREEMYYQTLSAPKPRRNTSPLEAFSDRYGQRGTEVGEPDRPPRPAPAWRPN